MCKSLQNAKALMLNSNEPSAKQKLRLNKVHLGEEFLTASGSGIQPEDYRVHYWSDGKCQVWEWYNNQWNLVGNGTTHSYTIGNVTYKSCWLGNGSWSAFN